jgi:transposase
MRKLQPVCDDAFRAALAASARATDEARFVHRLHVVLLVGLGHNCYEVAQWASADPRSVERWVHAYLAGGAEMLRDHHCGGRPGSLTDAQWHQLGSDLAQSPAALGYGQTGWSGKLLARHLEHSCHLRLSLRHCQRLLQRLGH